MAIQNRRGIHTDFDATKMVAGEFAIVQSGDPNNTNGTSVYICFQNGSAKRLTLIEDLDTVVGSLSNLETTDKTSIVDAINELAEKSSILFGTSSTGGSTRDKVVTCADFEAVDGALIAITVSQTNTVTNARFNVNGTGAKSIYSNHEASTDTSWLTKGTYLFVYNSTNGGRFTLIGATERIASDTAPVMDGTAAVGTSKKYARADHVHPSDTTRATVAALNETNAEVSQLKQDLTRLYDFSDEYLRYNLFDGVYIHAASLVYTDTMTGKMDFSNTSGRTAIIEIKPSTKYWINKYDTSDRWRIYTSSVYPDANTVLKAREYAYYNVARSVTTDADEHYLIVTVSVTSQEPRLCITDFEQDGFIGYDDSELKINTDLMNANALEIQALKSAVSDFAVFNLFDSEYMHYSITVYENNTADLSSENKLYRSAIIKANPSTTYYIQKYDTSDRFRVATCDHYPESGDSLSLLFNQPSATNAIVKTNATTKYLVVLVSITSQEPRLCITEDVGAPEYLNPDEYFKKESGGNKTFYFLDDFTGTYSCPNTVHGGSTSDTVNLIASEPTAITNIYDSLVADFPSYVSKTDLATASGYTISQYDFSYMEIENNSTSSVKKPKIAISAGVHGHEQGSCWCLAQLMDLLSRNTESDLLTAIKENVDFSIIPVANPYGFAHNQRKNENGIDINRNFSVGFTAGSDPASEYYGGTVAESETETQALIQFLGNNTDAVLVLDYHNIASGYPLYYLYNTAQATMCNAVFTTISREWRKQYSGFPTNRLLGYCNGGTGGSFAMYSTAKGYDSFTLETPWIMPVVGSSQYDKATVMTGIDVISNTILAIIKSLT